jgi:hypothetical protein
MKSIRRVAICAAAFLMAAIGAEAQMGFGGPPTMRGVFHPTVGNGAVYEVTAKDGKKTAMEIDVVGKEGDGVWMEITMAMNQGSMNGDMIMKMLTVTSGPNAQNSKMIMKLPNAPAMEMPTSMGGRSHEKVQPTDIRTSAEDVGSESITVPAGTFTCEHYHMKDGSGDVWVTDKISPWGVAKYQGQDSSMVAMKVVTGATDKITEKPIPFDPMKLAAAMGGKQQ